MFQVNFLVLSYSVVVTQGHGIYHDNGHVVKVNGSSHFIYKLHVNGRTYYDARDECIKDGNGTLAILKTEKRHARILQGLKEKNISSQFWIGLRRHNYNNRQYRWMWEDGSRSKFNRWDPNNPNKDYAIMSASNENGSWTTTDSSHEYFYMCQTEKDLIFRTTYVDGSTCFNYKLYDNDKTYNDARDKCTARNKTLAILNTREKHDHIRQALKEKNIMHHFWIGLWWKKINTSSGMWRWEDGSEFDFHSWNPDNQNKTYTIMSASNNEGSWTTDENNSQHKYSFMCQGQDRQFQELNTTSRVDTTNIQETTMKPPSVASTLTNRESSAISTTGSRLSITRVISTNSYIDLLSSSTGQETSTKQPTIDDTPTTTLSLVNSTSVLSAVYDDGVCEAPEYINNATLVLASSYKATYRFLHVIRYHCNEGYTHVTGDLALTCVGNNTWSGDFPSCILVDCDDPDIPAHANINHQSGTQYQHVVTFNCHSGFTPKDGAVNRYCGASGRWNGSLPHCVAPQYCSCCK